MIASRAIEARITRQLLLQRNTSVVSAWPRAAERAIAIAAATVGLVLLGSWLQELLWVLISCVAALALGVRSS